MAKRLPLIVAVLVLVGAIPALLKSEPSSVRRSFRTWSQYLGGADSSQYSALDQVNKSTVSRLDVVWRYPTADSRSYRFNPIVVDGTMFVLAKNNSIVALDALTGKEKWSHANEGAVGDRGINYWESSDRSERRLLYLNAGSLTAIDARTGAAIPGFGDQGRVDVRVGLNRDLTKIRRLQTNNPGRIYQDLFIVSLPAGGAGYVASPGDIHAYDVRSGKLAWVFHTVPERGEPGAETWPDAALATGSGVHNWSELTVDEERGIVYIPTGTARYDFYGGNRPGANLYANSVLALDAKTGKRKWHFQAVHHDLWDYDLATSPKLLTVKHDGRDVDVIAQASKHGFLFVLERDTGRPLWPIEERPGAAVRRARRADLADAAVSNAAASVCAAVVHRERHQPASVAGSTGETATDPAQLDQQGTVHAAKPAGIDSDARQQRRCELGPPGRGSGEGPGLRDVEGGARAPHTSGHERGLSCRKIRAAPILARCLRPCPPGSCRTPPSSRMGSWWMKPQACHH